MPGDPFNVVNDESDPNVHSEPKTSSSEGAEFGPPGAGHVFEDGFSIPNDLRGGPGISSSEPNDSEIDEDLGELEIPGAAPPGGPAVPGFDGSLSRTPADAAADPNAPVIPPATPDTFICLVGPCKHYRQLQLGVDKPKGEVFDRPELWRACMDLHDREGEISLKDANVPLCSGYTPPWWSVEGQAKKVEVRKRLAQINGLKQTGLAELVSRVSSATRHLKEAAEALRGKKE